MTDRETAILWLDSFVKNKDPFTLIPKQLIRLIHDVLKEQPNIVRCKNCKHFEPDGIYTMCYRHNGLSQNEDWFCADGERK